jgi:hypothetical protein
MAWMSVNPDCSGVYAMSENPAPELSYDTLTLSKKCDPGETSLQRSFPRTPFKKLLSSLACRFPCQGNRQARAYREVFGEEAGEKPFFKKVLPRLLL